MYVCVSVYVYVYVFMLQNTNGFKTLKDSNDFIQESTISYIHQEYVVCYD